MRQLTHHLSAAALAVALAACGGSQTAPESEPPAQADPPPTTEERAATGDSAGGPVDQQPAPDTTEARTAEKDATETGGAMTADERARVVGFVQKMVDAVDASGGDCDALAPKAIELLDAHGPFLQEIAGRLSEDQARTFMAENQDLMQSFGTAMGTVEGCAKKNQKLAAALQKMPPPPN